jgi:hypothetical protein
LSDILKEFLFLYCYKGSFTNYVYKRMGVGSPKMSTFFNMYKVENVKRGE